MQVSYRYKVPVALMEEPFPQPSCALLADSTQSHGTCFEFLERRSRGGVSYKHRLVSAL